MHGLITALDAIQTRSDNPIFETKISAHFDKSRSVNMTCPTILAKIPASHIYEGFFVNIRNIFAFISVFLRWVNTKLNTSARIFIHYQSWHGPGTGAV